MHRGDDEGEVLQSFVFLGPVPRTSWISDSYPGLQIKLADGTYENVKITN